jgi:hypothetical protein
MIARRGNRLGVTWGIALLLRVKVIADSAFAS